MRAKDVFVDIDLKSCIIKRSSTFLTFSLWSLRLPSLNIKTSLIYAVQKSSKNSLKTWLMYRWNVAGTPVRPKRVTSHLKRPNRVRKAVFHLSSSSIWILWKTAMTSSLVNYLAFAITQNVSLMSGSR